jgi:hypothetical protein
VSKELASQINVDVIMKLKNMGKSDVALVEEHDDGWIVIGTFPIVLLGLSDR